MSKIFVKNLFASGANEKIQNISYIAAKQCCSAYTADCVPEDNN